jgi:hypothetical protein
MGHNHINVRTNQLSRQLAKVLVLSLRPSVFDHDIRALDVAEVTQTQSESLELSCVTGRRRGPEEANPRTFPSCCARAASGHAAAAPPSVNMNSRRRMWIAMRPLPPEVVCMPIKGTISRFSEGTNNAFALRKS